MVTQATGSENERVFLVWFVGAYHRRRTSPAPLPVLKCFQIFSSAYFKMGRRKKKKKKTIRATSRRKGPRLPSTVELFSGENDAQPERAETCRKRVAGKA